MNLLDKMKNVIYRPEFFSSHACEAKGGLRFYSLLLLFFIGVKVLLAIPVTVQFYQAILSGKWQEQQTIITGIYPDELNLSVRQGVVSTNVSEPYPIAVPKEWRDKKNDTPENFLVIDTTKSIETSDFAAQDTLLILGKNGFGYHDPNKGEFRIYDFRDKGWRGSMDVNKATYDTFVMTGSLLLQRMLLIGCLVLPFIMYAFLWVAYLLYLVFGAVIVWFGARLRGHQIGYGEAYAAGLYLLPIPFLYEFLSSYGQGILGNVPFAFTLILFVMTLINFPKAVSAGSSQPEDINRTMIAKSDVGMIDDRTK